MHSMLVSVVASNSHYLNIYTFIFIGKGTHSTREREVHQSLQFKEKMWWLETKSEKAGK